MSNKKVVSLKQLVGGGYDEFIKSQKRYVVCKGSRGSKKSKTAALYHIAMMIKYPQANCLVIRKTERTLKASCYADLQWAINRMGLDDYFHCTVNPLEIVYKPYGNKIMFRGLDDPLKITSITVPKGVLNLVWINSGSR